MWASRRYSVMMVEVAPYSGRMSTNLPWVSGRRGWWSMIDIKVKTAEDLMVPRLVVHQGLAVEILGVDLLDGVQGDPQEFHQALVLGPGDGADGGDDAGREAVPQQAFQGQGAGDGVRVRVDEDEEAVLVGKELVESLYRITHVGHRSWAHFNLEGEPGAINTRGKRGKG